MLTMQRRLPPWPTAIPRRFKPFARLLHDPKLHPLRIADQIALGFARDLQAKDDSLQCSGLTGTWTECFFTNTADFAALASSATEASLLSPGPKEQPVIPALFFDGTKAVGRGVSLLARGVFSNTGTPTQIFQLRLGTTSGPSFITGTSVGVSAAITGASGITNKWWELRFDIICNTPGIGTGNTTLNCAGYVASPGGFASPFVYALEPTTPDTATWTATIDNSVTQYLNVTLTWSASSASNTITLKQLLMLGLN